MAQKNNLQSGDRVALTAKFLKNTGQFTGSSGQRRGTFINYELPMARVKWDDFEANAVYYVEQYGDDYVQECRANGSRVHAANICKVGSAKFACNDL